VAARSRRGRVLRGGPELEHLDREGRSGKGIEDGCDVERGAEELLDLAQIHHPDVVDEPGADRPRVRGGCGRGCWRLRAFPAVTADRASRHPPARAREHAGTQVLAAESEACEELCGGTNDVGGTADGWRGLDERARGSRGGVGGLLPIQDRVRADEKSASSLSRAPGEQGPNLEDAKALGWREVRPVPLGDL
jgi:hypothetical protein